MFPQLLLEIQKNDNVDIKGYTTPGTADDSEWLFLCALCALRNFKCALRKIKMFIQKAI